MGIAAITLSQHFHRVLGVELSPRLLEAADRNLRRVSVKNVELFCADARTFEHDLDDVTHVYMFNPFPAPVVSDVLENIKKSLLRAPRTVTIIYKLPVFHATILEHGFTHLQNIHPPYTHPFAIYHSIGTS
jgi:predicted RNA methylase